MKSLGVQHPHLTDCVGTKIARSSVRTMDELGYVQADYVDSVADGYISASRSVAIVARYNSVGLPRHPRSTNFSMIPSGPTRVATMPFPAISSIAILATVVFAAAAVIIAILFVATGPVFGADYVRSRSHRPQMIRH